MANTGQNGNSANGRYDVEAKQLSTRDPLIRGPVKALIQDFSPIWFTWCMNSGIIAILLHQHPYQFEGIRTLGTIFFAFDFLVYILFSVFLLLRLAMFRSQAFHEITTDPSQLPLLACWGIGFLTIAPNVSLYISQAYWGGRWAMLTAYVLWWFGAGFTLSILFFVFIILTRRHMAGGPSTDGTKHNIHTRPVPSLVIIPAVGVATVAVTGALVASYSNFMNARLAVPIIITAFVLVGLAMFLAVILYSILWTQLFETGFPPPDQVTSMFVFVGPCGQCAAALQGLGSAATAWFGQYNEGPFLTAQSASSLNAACVLGALLLLGGAAFLTLFSIYAVIDVAISTRQVKWTPSWNAVIFPVATMTTATTYLSNEMNSPTFKVLTSIQLVGLVAMFLVNIVFFSLGVFKGEIFIVREDPRVKQKLEEQKDE